MLIPGKAIVEQMGEFFVFVARDTFTAGADSTKKNNTGESGRKVLILRSKRPSLHAFQKK
jgi:hypothetical protein